MREFLVFIGFLLFILLSYLCVTNHAPLIQMDIQSRVSDQFVASNLPGDVRVSGRDVVLTGFAETDELRTMSAQLVRSVYGVRKVENQIRVMAPPPVTDFQDPDAVIISEPEVDAVVEAPTSEVVSELKPETETETETEPKTEASVELLPQPDYIVVEAVPLVVDACQEKLADLLKKETIVFASSQDVIKRESYDVLDMISEEAKKCQDSVIHIYGYTDSSGDAEKNKDLSLKRARSVGAYLVDKGVRQEIKFYGEGSAKPVEDNATPEGRAKNRRIEFKVIKK